MKNIVKTRELHFIAIRESYYTAPQNATKIIMYSAGDGTHFAYFERIPHFI